MHDMKKPTLPPGSMPAPSKEELDKKAISLGNDVGTSEVIIVCEDEVSRDNLFGAFMKLSDNNPELEEN